MTLKSGLVYEGEFSNNSLKGVGKITNNLNIEYIGYFDNSELGNFARVNYPDGSYFEGVVKNFNRSGIGIQTFIDKSQLKGMWVNDKFIGAAIPVTITMGLCVLSFLIF